MRHMPSDQREPVLRLAGTSKVFPGVRALDGVSFSLSAGEVVALVGENGAGKSTLIKILGGIYPADSGQTFIDGRPVAISSARAALGLGIHIIHQELNLAGNLNIAENIFLGKQPARGPRWLPLTDWAELHGRAGELLDRLGLDVSTHTLVGRLSLAQRQLVEIGKALSTESRVVIFDEPTSSLSAGEERRLMELIEQLRAEGVAVLYVSHRLEEVAQLADRVVVLRDGRLVGELARQEIDTRRIVSLMVGRELAVQPAKRLPRERQPALRAVDLRYRGAPEPVRFDIGQGEIVGMAGLVGAGRTRLARALFGIAPRQSGSLELGGRTVRVGSPREAIAAGLFLVPEDRKTQGLFLQDSLAENISVAALPGLGRWGLFNRRAARELADRQIGALGIRAAGADQRVAQLSGGNQQKTVLARWLALRPRVLILDEPTRGIDVGAKEEIYALIASLAAEGVGILLISSDLGEIVTQSDRVLVMRTGRIAGELAGEQITQEAVMHLAIGSS
jgi:ribose transport system ATP-binding protein